MKTTTQETAKAIYIINKHAKNAPELYSIKNRAIQQLLKEGRAQKLGLHYSPNPGNALQKLDVLIRKMISYFIIPPRKKIEKN